ncbi:hypothetical protein [Mesotoga sp.]|uniref:hypothetical protein n=1 Tax=Mesotoga sp. TaxID=2053577 RepID=UPI00345EE947
MALIVDSVKLIKGETSRFVRCAGDCQDDAEKEAYQLCKRFLKESKVQGVIAQPVFKNIEIDGMDTNQFFLFGLDE